jgi:hypothetical protein
MDLLLKNPMTDPVEGPDRSAAHLTKLLDHNIPFMFVKYGDGALECMRGEHGHTCDGEIYTPYLRYRLSEAWNHLFLWRNVYIGDWRSASFDAGSEFARYESEYDRLLRAGYMQGTHVPAMIHFEALLLMRESEALLEFYRTVRNDSRRKLLLGPREWEPGAEVLRANFIGLPVERQQKSALLQKAVSENYDVLLYGAGMAGTVAVIDAWMDDPSRTYISIGSALDPVYRGTTRRQQIPRDRAKEFFTRLCE